MFYSIDNLSPTEWALTTAYCEADFGTEDVEVEYFPTIDNLLDRLREIVLEDIGL